MTGNQTIQQKTVAEDSRSTRHRSSSSRRYSSHSRSARKIFKLRIIILVLCLALMVTTFGWMAVSLNLANVRDQFQEFQISSRQEIALGADQAAEIARLKGENEVLVRGLIPGLRLLEFDSTITIDKGYFKNIGFTLTGNSQTKNYECRIVLQNNSFNMVTPAVTLLLFNESGMQVGSTLLSEMDLTSEAESKILQPNETRSYTGRIKLNIPTAEPKYFLILVE